MITISFHKNLEDRLKTDTSYTLLDVLDDPGRSAWGEIFEKNDFEELFNGSDKWKSRKNDLAILASFAAFTVPHELAHAYTNIATGGVNERIVFNTLYGGHLWSKLVPGSEADTIFPLMGAYVEIAEFGSSVAPYLTLLAPYIATPIGIYLMEKAKEKKSLALAIAGSGTLIAHAGGIIGDWFTLGRQFVFDAMDPIYSALGMEDAQPGILPLVGGFYLGWNALNFTYLLSQATVNHARGLFK